MRRRYAKKSRARKYRRSTRKVYRRSRRSNKSTIRNSRPSAIIADRFITKMKYGDRYAVPAPGAVGVNGAYLFNLNSVYDPDRTGVGHQPWGRDQLAGLYNRYRVFAVSWRISFYNAPQAAQASFAVVPVNTDATLGGTSLSVLRETPRAIVKISSVDKPTVFTGRITLSKLNGQTTSEYKGSDRFSALNNADPSELMTLQVVANPAVQNTSYTFEAQLTYHVEWFDPLPVGQS